MNTIGEVDWDIDNYKIPYEPEEHWQLRKEFLCHHKGNIPEEKLASLAQVYCNIILLGCRYPAAVMKQVAVLGEGLGSSYKLKKKQLLQRHFVKASDAAQQKVQRKTYNGNVARDGNKQKPKSFNIPLKKPSLTFVKATPDTEADNPTSSFSTPNMDLLASTWEKYSRMSQPAFRQCDEQEVEVETIDENLCEPPQKKFVRGVPDGDVEIIESPKKIARCEPDDDVEIIESPKNFVRCEPDDIKIIEPPKIFNKAFPNTNEQSCESPKKYKKIVWDLEDGKKESSPVKIGISSVSPTGNNINDSQYRRVLSQLAQKIKSKKQSKNPLDTFFIMDNPNYFGTTANIIMQSAQFSDLTINLDFSVNKSNNLVCTVYLENLFIGQSEGESQKIAKQNACSKALDFVLKKCWTLQKRTIRCEDDEKMSLGEVVVGNTNKASKGKTSTQSSVDKVLQPSNKGMQLMKLMGWSGGGLGKDGEGIVDPISPATLLGRSGLGSQDYHFANANKSQVSTSKAKFTTINEDYKPSNVIGNSDFKFEDFGSINDNQFKQCATVIVEQFAHNYDMEDLAFTPEFSNPQRKIVHELCRRYKLKSKSYGKDDKRFLVVSKKRTWRELILYVIENRGKTEKFELFPPGKSNLKKRLDLA